VRYSTLISTLVVALIFALLSYAGEPKGSPEAFMHSYLDGYEKYLTGGDNADVALVTEHFSEPLVMMPPSGSAPMATHEDFGPNIKYFLDNALKKKGVVKLKWAKLQMAALSDTQALASGLVNALDKNGNIVEQRASIYLLTKSKDGWAVSVNLPHSPSTVPSLTAAIVN
jgi:ketosteroid isomerase-like protein